MNKSLFVSREDALDIVFANRNRAYGAYQLRRQYPQTLGRALGFGLLFIATLMAIPHIMKAFSNILPASDTPEEVYKISEVRISPPPVQPPVPRTPPPVSRPTRQFLPPVVEEDDKVPEEAPKPSIEDLTNSLADIGKADVDGSSDAPPSLNDPELSGIEDNVPTSTNDEPMELFDLQKPPFFPGGEAELMRYLAKNIRYPELAREADIQGTVVLTFVIGKDGSIGDVAVLRELGGGCSKEAVRVLKGMPNWSPGEAGGHPVKVRFTLPVKFKLQ